MPTYPDTLARQGRRSRQRRRGVVLTIVAVVAGAALIAGASVMMADPERVDITIENPTPYRVHVEVRPAEGGGRLGLGAVSPGTSMTFPRVIDQGERWLFEYSSGRVDSPPVEMSREALTNGAVVIPDSFEEQLRDAGLLPSSPS